MAMQFIGFSFLLKETRGMVDSGYKGGVGVDRRKFWTSAMTLIQLGVGQVKLKDSLAPGHRTPHL